MMKFVHGDCLWMEIRIERCCQSFPWNEMKIWSPVLIYVASGFAENGVRTSVTHRGCSSWKTLVLHYRRRGLLLQWRAEHMPVLLLDAALFWRLFAQRYLLDGVYLQVTGLMSCPVSVSAVCEPVWSEYVVWVDDSGFGVRCSRQWFRSSQIMFNRGFVVTASTSTVIT